MNSHRAEIETDIHNSLFKMKIKEMKVACTVYAFFMVYRGQTAEGWCALCLVMSESSRHFRQTSKNMIFVEECLLHLLLTLSKNYRHVLHVLDKTVS